MVEVLRKLLLVSAKEVLAVRGCLDAYRTNTHTGNYQCDEERYSEIEFHLGPLRMPYWLILEFLFQRP